MLIPGVLLACGPAPLETETGALGLSSWVISGTLSSPGNNECGPGAIACTKGNYNEAFKESRCSQQATPGWDASADFYRGRVTVHRNGQGGTWDKNGTAQDHKGVCVRRNTTWDAVYFHDGCTGYLGGSPPKMNRGALNGWSPRNWGQVFHGACIMHDLCYQNEPGFSGRSRADCDRVLHDYAHRICDMAYEDNRRTWRNPFPKKPRSKCRTNADAMYTFLTLGPRAHYDRFNFAQPWRDHEICAPGLSFNPLTTRCQ